jgi:haloalkane dehalogenase
VKIDSIRALYPFESHVLDLGGIQYHYLDEGRGEPIVMLHGNPTWSFYYRHLIADLRGRYRVIAPDHIGCGLSDKPQKYEYTLKRHIANIEALIQHLALKRITLVMHDWGGPIGMGYAVRHPDNVRRFVIFNTVAFWSPHIPLILRLCRIPLFGALAIRGLNLFAGLATIIACRHRERMTKEVRAGYLFPYNSYANRVAHLRFVQDIPVSTKHPSFRLLQSIENGLVQFKRHPMIIIWGARDPVFTDPLLESWKERFPEASVKRIDDAGHYVVEDAYERIVPWVNEFLEKNSI